MYPLENVSKGAAALLSLENGEESDARQLIDKMSPEEAESFIIRISFLKGIAEYNRMFRDW